MIDEEIKLTRDTADGARAQALLNDPYLKAAFDALEAQYIEAWKRASLRDVEGREKAWSAVQVLAQVQEHLSTIMTNGAIAQRDLEILTRRTRKLSVA